MKLPFQFQLRHLLLLCPFILLAPVWLAGNALYWGTPSSQFIPWWWQAWQTISAGEWPLWNPLLGMGAPLLANYQSALFYPPHWIYFGLAALGGLPLMAWGMAFIVSLHLAWAGWGMGLLVKRLGKSELAQTVARVAGKKINIKHVEGPVGVQSRNFSNARIYSLGWTSKVSVEEGIRRTYPWIEAQVKAAVPVHLKPAVQPARIPHTDD